MIIFARLGPMPGTSISFSGSEYSTSSVCSPKALISSLAVAGPMPRIMPLHRYFSMPESVVGFSISQRLTLICRP